MATFQIGSLAFENALWMAPMEGVTDVPFRAMVRKHGCGVRLTQMIHAEALLRAPEKRLAEVSRIEPAEGAVGLQLCGSEPRVIGEAAKKAVDLGAAFVDINMGCPAKNIVAAGCGAALLRDPARAAAIVEEVGRSISVPVTVKIRAGWDDRYRNALELGAVLQSAGAASIAVHARTREQKHRGAPDWNLIRELKERMTIPVIGNGGVMRFEDIQRMKDETGADGVMVARGALGNPWIFSGIPPTISSLQETLLEHLDLHLGFYSNKGAALLTFRKHLVWYTRGLADSAEFRLTVFKESSLAGVKTMIEQFFGRFDPGMTHVY